MVNSLLSQPYIRAGIHHIVATMLFTLYAMRVSPHIAALPFITVFFQTGALFLILYLLRLSSYLIGIRTNAITDIFFYTIAAIFYAAWHQAFYHFPLVSNMKIAFGMIILGSLITIDLAITHTRIQQDHPSSFVTPPKIFIPLAVQIGSVFVFFILSLAMLLSIIASEDLLWLVQHDSLAVTVDTINHIVRTFLVVALVFTLYAICISRNAIALMRKQLAYQVQALDKANERDFDNKVPMNTLGELSIIAHYTNNILTNLTTMQATESEKQHHKANPNTYRDDNKNTDNAVINNLAALIAVRDGASRAHLMRIQRYVKALAVRLSAKGFHKEGLNLETIGLLYQCAPLYDIGKIAIPDSILKKPAKLSDNQLAIVKTHAQIGADVLNIEGEENNPFYAMARELAVSHHEWWDGSGYPKGLKEKQIPIVGRIMALADSYDAMISKRSYRAAFDHEKVKSNILKLRGIQFDPDVVDAFLEIEAQFVDINQRYRDELLYTLVS